MAPIIKLIDQLALLDFKAKIREDPFGIVSSWSDSLHFCQWQGVICDQPHQTQRVTTLDLWSLKLVGSVSPHIGNLSFLQKLILQDNSFYNKIPPAIGRLGRLQVLQLRNNMISGKIPSNISGCANLIMFLADYNLLAGGSNQPKT